LGDISSWAMPKPWWSLLYSTIVLYDTYLNCVSNYDTSLQAVIDYQHDLCQSKSILSLAKKFEREFSIAINTSNNIQTVESRKAGLLLKNAVQSVFLISGSRNLFKGSFSID